MISPYDPFNATDYDACVERDNHGTWNSYLIAYERTVESKSSLGNRLLPR
jgi:hypothetical protein